MSLSREAVSSSKSQPNSIVFPIVVMLAGVAIVLGALFADSIGVSGGGDGLGWKQLIAMILGLVILVAGAGLWLRRKG